MAKYDYNSYKEKEESRKEFGNYVKYFSLKDDKDFTYIRLAYASKEDFLKNVDIVDVHRIQDADHKFPIAVCCLRDKDDPKEKCPLCAKGNEDDRKVSTKVYLKVIEYVASEKNTNKFSKNENGVITPTAKIWERPSYFVDDILPYIEDGDINKLFKVVRNGKAGYAKTSYVFVPCSKEIYPDNLFVKDFSGFDNYNPSTVHAERTAEQMERYLATGSFFEKKEEEKEETSGEVFEIKEEVAPQPTAQVVKEQPSAQQTVEVANEGVVQFQEKEAVVETVTPQRARRDYSQYN